MKDTPRRESKPAMVPTHIAAHEARQRIVQRISAGWSAHRAAMEGFEAMVARAQLADAAAEDAKRQLANVTADADRMAMLVASMEHELGRGPLAKLVPKEGVE